LIGALKRVVRRRFPAALSALHNYRLARRLQSRPMRDTPLGFRFRGHEQMEAGTFEPLESEIIRKYSGEGSVLVDIGANMGYFVCMARRAGSHVVAVEPMAQNLDILYANIEANGWKDIEIFPVGVGAEPGMAVLYGGGTAASLVPNWIGTSDVWKRTIPISTMDILLGNRFEDAPMLIKIDVEGVEHLVLQGAEKTLSRTPAPRWLVEVCLTENHPDGCNPYFGDVFKIFYAHGYTARSVEAGLREVTATDVDKWVANRRRDFGYVSYLFEKSS